jgi:tetratricopeptide (TPR) repeat protein
MFLKLREWFASQSDSRISAFRKAKQLYEDYLSKNITVQVFMLSEEQQEQANLDSDLKDAERLYNFAISQSKKESQLTHQIGYHQDIAVAKFDLGMLFNIQGRLDEARKELEEALEIFDSFPQLSSENHRIISGCYYHLGVNDIYLESITDARNNFRKSLNIDRQISDSFGIRSCEEALEYCDNADS